MQAAEAVPCYHEAMQCIWQQLQVQVGGGWLPCAAQAAVHAPPGRGCAVLYVPELLLRCGHPGSKVCPQGQQRQRHTPQPE